MALVDVRPMPEIMSTYGKTLDAYVSHPCSHPGRVAYIPLAEIMEGRMADHPDYVDLVEPILEEGGYVAFACRAGVRSALACEAAQQEGVECVNFEPGAEGWDVYHQG